MATPPARVGRYVVREVLGTGGFATVYRATDERLRSDVAVKVLAENHSFDPEVRERFIEEGRRLRRVRSPFLVTVHELGDTERAQPFLVLDWADRGDLASRLSELRRRGRAPAPGDVVTVARELASALDALHGHDLVHRDLAPRNVLLRSTGPAAAPASSDGPEALVGRDERLLLADLGLSKDLAMASGLTGAAGTSGFTPPEQRDRAGVVDRRSDIWAASALIVWVTTGDPPDDAGTWRRTATGAGWPPELVRSLGRGLSERPDDRYASIDEWFLAVEAALRPRAPARPDTAASRSRRRLGTASAVAAALVVGAATGAVATRDTPAGPAVQTRQLPDGRLRSTVEEAGVTITLDGPTELGVGDAEQLSVAVDGASTWLWVEPDGSVRSEEPSFEMVPASPGEATFRVLAVGDRGRVVEAAHTVRVPDDGS